MTHSALPIFLLVSQAPGLLVDGSVVDVWGRKEDVDWRLPGAGAPCTSTSRPGRWRSYPYLAGLEGEDGQVLWDYLCHQWNRENHADKYPGRQLVKFNFFMLQADVLPNMGFSATRKRLIHSHECIPQSTNDTDATTTETNTIHDEGESSARTETNNQSTESDIPAVSVDEVMDESNANAEDGSDTAGRVGENDDGGMDESGQEETSPQEEASPPVDETQAEVVVEAAKDEAADEPSPLQPEEIRDEL